MQSLGVEYKNKWGVYRIFNSMNGKFYIGSSVDLHKRSCEHIRLLNIGKHINLILQRSYNKSSEFYKIEVLEVVNEHIGRKELLKLEQFYLDKYHSYDNNFGYNYNSKATGVVFTDEIKKKISNSLKGRVANNKNTSMSESQKQQLIHLKQSEVPNIIVYDIWGNKLFLFSCIRSSAKALTVDRRSI